MATPWGAGNKKEILSSPFSLSYDCSASSFIIILRWADGVYLLQARTSLQHNHNFLFSPKSKIKKKKTWYFCFHERESWETICSQAYLSQFRDEIRCHDDPACYTITNRQFSFFFWIYLVKALIFQLFVLCLIDEWGKLSHAPEESATRLAMWGKLAILCLTFDLSAGSYKVEIFVILRERLIGDFYIHVVFLFN